MRATALAQLADTVDLNTELAADVVLAQAEVHVGVILQALVSLQARRAEHHPRQDKPRSLPSPGTVFASSSMPRSPEEMDVEGQTGRPVHSLASSQAKRHHQHHRHQLARQDRTHPLSPHQVVEHTHQPPIPPQGMIRGQSGKLFSTLLPSSTTPSFTSPEYTSSLPGTGSSRDRSAHEIGNSEPVSSSVENAPGLVLSEGLFPFQTASIKEISRSDRIHSYSAGPVQPSTLHCSSPPLASAPGGGSIYVTPVHTPSESEGDRFGRLKRVCLCFWFRA